MKALLGIWAAFDPRAGGGREESRRPRRDGTRAEHWLFRGALLSLLLLAVLSTDLPEIHAHDADTPGFYNEECPLGRLALPHWALAAPPRDTLPQPAPVLDPATPSTTAESSAPPAPFAARAPPATS